MLEERAETQGAKAAFSFQGQAVTFERIWRSINTVAGFLLERGLERGERVVIAIPNGEEFFAAFYGAQRAGGIAVPLFPDSGVDRIASIAKHCGARLIVLPALSPKRRELEAGGLSPLDVSEMTSIDSAGTPGGGFPEVHPDDIAFLQYTSGSTGNPKAVMLTQSNLLTNMRQMITGMQITNQDVFVSWLPVYHDMGLILMTMVPFYLAADVHLLPADLRSVRDWLRTIDETQGTFTAAPDFAYRLCLRHLDSLRGFDVTSLRVALNAAEPVRAVTIRGFELAFGLENVMVAGYGLAEATVGVSMWTPRTPPRVDSHGIVSVGAPFPEVEVRILAERPGERAGEILIRSAANSRGYFANAEATADLFTDGGYIRSGDLGYLDEDGNLYIVGRKKNIIKHAGETVSPQEIEETVDAIDGIRYSAAIGIDRGRAEGEQAYVFAEVRNWTGDADQAYELSIQIVEAIHRRLGLRPARVYLVRPRTIPKTHNGKIQHVVLRDQYLDGSLREHGKILYPDY